MKKKFRRFKKKMFHDKNGISLDIQLLSVYPQFVFLLICRCAYTFPECESGGDRKSVNWLVVLNRTVKTSSG